MSAQAGTVLVVGSYAVGFTFRSERVPIGGETLLAGEFDHGPGGKGSNQAIQAARAGARTQLLAAIGDDPFGRAALDLWAGEGIDTDAVLRRDDDATGAGAILLDDAGENRLYPGANRSLDAAAVEAARDRFATAAVVLTQLEIPLEAAAAALRAGRAQGATTILNPAPACPVPDALLADADVVVPNETEARILAGLDPAAEADERDLCRMLRARGARTVVMTLGVRGALVVADGEPAIVPAPTVDVVDTTGAGDAFNGTLAAALAAGHDLHEAVERAVVAGALACTRLGVVPALAHHDLIEAERTQGASR